MKTGRTEDGAWMRRALELAARGEGLTRPNPPVGAVVVRRGAVVGEGWHRRAGGAHAERIALQAAGPAARGADLYVTLEPCSTTGRTPPCTDAVLASGVARVVVGAVDPNPLHAGRGLRLLRRAGLEVVTGGERAAATRLLEPFACCMQEGRALLTLKLASSLDGCLCDAAGVSRWITGPAARRAAHALRRSADAILVGAGTACADDPGLLPRPAAGRAPWRIVLDGAGRLPAGLRILTDAAKSRTVVATTPAGARRLRRRLGAEATLWVCATDAEGRVDLQDLLRRCAAAGMLHVLCEGGGETAGGLLRAGLVDRLVVFYSPRVLGGQGAVRLFGATGVPLATDLGWERVALTPLGPDWRVDLRPRRASPRNRMAGSETL